MSPRRIIAITSSASFLAPLNSSMVAVALPDVRDDFGIGVGPLTLLVSVYLVAVAVAQPVSGRLGDALGHRRMMLAGLALLLASSLGAALAWNFWVLILLRALQGISAAMVMPNGTAYLRRSLDPSSLGRSLGYNGAAISSGAAMGPVLGGLAVGLAGWRSMFLINVPAAIVIACFVFALPRDHGHGRIRGTVDFASLAALAGAFAGLVVLGNAARINIPALSLAAVLALPAALLAYWLLYRRRGAGVVDLRLFTRTDYAAAAATTALSNLVMYTALISIPIYLDEIEGTSEAAIGLILFSLSVSSVLISPFSGRLADAKGPRLPAVVGALVILGSAVILASDVGRLAPWTLGLPLAGVGVGMGLAGAAQQSAALRAWGAEVAGSASGTLSMMRYVGSVAGAAALAAVVGAAPTVGEVQFLCWILGAVAAFNLLAATMLRPGLQMIPESQPRSTRATA